MTARVRKLIQISAGFLLLTMAYSNCSLVGSTHSESSASSEDARKALCEQDLKVAFGNSYRPFVSTPGLCMNCHSDGGLAQIPFASGDLNTGFNTFMQMGSDHVDQNAINPNHARGITGPSLQSQVTSAHQTWDPAYKTYETCLAGTNATGTDSSATEVLTLADRVTPALYFSDKLTVTLSWDLQSSDATPFNQRVPAQFLVDAKADYAEDGTLIGYAFTNPRVQMTTGESELEVEGVVMRINGQKASNAENFLSAHEVARGIDPKILFTGTVHVPLSSVSTSDRISAGLGYLNLRTRTDNPPTPPTPTLSSSSTSIRTAMASVSVSNDSTARRWCLTTSTVRPSSTATPCPGFENATSTGWLTARPTNFDVTSSGLTPTSGQAIPVQLWIANSDLKINAQPAILTFTFDTTAPAAPLLSNITLGNTQIVDLNIGNSSETVMWCVAESAVMTDVQKSTICNSTTNSTGFLATKPTFTGLRGGGIRYVEVYVRDLAGNLGNSVTQTVNNTYNRITFTDLSSATTGARGVFANSCVSCHKTGGDAVALAKWDATSYTDSVAKKTKLMTQAKTPSATHQGFLAAKDSALILLWLTQTATPVQ